MIKVKEYRQFLKKHNIISKKNTQKIRLEKGQDKLAFCLWRALINPHDELEAMQNFIKLRSSIKEGFLDLNIQEETNI